MNLNIGRNAVTTRLISSLIKSKVRGEDKNTPKEGVDLAGIAQKLFSRKQAEIDGEKAEVKAANE